MEERKVGYLPVVDQGQLVGIVYDRDVLRAQLNTLQSHCDQMHEYIDHLHQAGQD
jgi:hypothetical protein